MTIAHSLSLQKPLRMLKLKTHIDETESQLKKNQKSLRFSKKKSDFQIHETPMVTLNIEESPRKSKTSNSTLKIKKISKEEYVARHFVELQNIYARRCSKTNPAR